MIILGIETSCDDTGIALIECDQQKCRILSNLVSSQIKIHAPFGGVVPNLAARAHLENIGPCLKEALRLGFRSPTPKKFRSWTPKKQIDLIAVTIGPGLIPSLLVGTNFAKALAYNWQKPIIGINHIEGHIYANWLTTPQIEFPNLCLVVSGGHTQLVLMKNHGKYQLLGETRDDAAGEAFDKVAKLLNLGYPGGPIISQKAQKGNPQAFDLPRPMLNSQDFDFSFSGLKTAVLYQVKNRQKKISPKYINDMTASFQQAVIDVLVKKTIRAAKEFKTKTIMLSGGVAANQELRKQMEQAVKKELPKAKFQMPEIKLCTDNAAMIAIAAYYKKKPTSKQSWLQIAANANLKLVD
jgi:N6-L-threonylcarbamoyladenine synthase